MSEKKFKIYSSSAGSGKTYTLTKEYLKLALQTDNPHYFRHILAITFTNDAANEMKERILKALKGFAYPDALSEKGQKQSRALLEQIAQEMTAEPDILAERALKVFAKIIYNYTDFAVSTIDSFVNKVINAFTRELEIPYNYEVDLDTEQLLQTAVDRVLEKVGREQKEQLSEFVVDWVTQKAEEGKNWARVAKELVHFSKDLINESAYPYIQPLRELSMQDFKQISRQLQAYQKELDSEIMRIAQQGDKLIRQRGLELDFLGKAKGSVAAYFHKHSEDASMDYRARAKRYTRQALDEDKWYSGKVHVAIDEIKPQLHQWMEEIEAIKDKEGATYQLVSVLLPHLYKLALIQEIEMELSEVKKENNAIHISDTNKKIAEIIRTEPVPYIFERVGEKYNHILIDEFQDTSVLQWENLLPLVENNLSEAFFNLIVGDSKQAIYRWRGGEMEQLVYLYNNRVEDLLKLSADGSEYLMDRYQLLEQNHQEARLAYNFRSTREIIEFNNDFFKVLVETDVGLEHPLFSLIYEGSHQDIPVQNSKQGGHIDIHFIDKGDLYWENTCTYVLELIHQAQEEGFALADIAVLTRGNAQGKEIANFLKSEQIDVISQTSLLLASDEKIRFLVAFLKVIHRPENRLAKSEALYLFYKVIKQQVPDADTNYEIKEVISQSIISFYDKINEEGYRLNYSNLQTLNIYELAEKLIGIFGLLREQSRMEYIFRFLDVILQFNLQKNATLEDFLEYWEEKKGSLSVNTPKDLQAVTITTIHKSKGLEYPVVIMAFTDWSFHPKVGQTMWVNLPPESNIFKATQSGKSLQTALVPMQKQLDDTPISEQYHNEMQKIFIENVNMLYVAFTRAVWRLHIVSRWDDFSKGANQKRTNFLLFQYLLAKEMWQEEERTYVLCQGQRPPNQASSSQEEDSAFIIEEFVSTDIFYKKVKPKNSKRTPAERVPSKS